MRDDCKFQRVRIRIVSGRGSPWEGDVLVTDGAVWLFGNPHCPLDDLAGVLGLGATNREKRLSEEAGFLLPRSI